MASLNMDSQALWAATLLANTVTCEENYLCNGKCDEDEGAIEFTCNTCKNKSMMIQPGICH